MPLSILQKCLENACNDFIHNSVWRKGELFIFVFDAEGVVLAHGDDYDLIWTNIKDMKGIGGMPLIKDMLQLGRKVAVSVIFGTMHSNLVCQNRCKRRNKYISWMWFLSRKRRISNKTTSKNGCGLF